MASQGNIGKQIADAIQDAIAEQDYSKLQETVKNGIDFAAKSVSEGLSQAAAATREAQQKRQREEAQRQQAEMQRRQAEQQRQRQELLNSSRFKNTNGLKISGYLMTIGGAVLAVALIFSSFVTYASSLFISTSILPTTTATLLVFAAASAIVSAFGGTRIGLAGRFATYQQIIGANDSYSIELLAKASGKSPKRVIKDLKKLISKGFFIQGCLDEDAGTLFITREARERFEQNRRQALEKRQQEQLEREAHTKAADGSTISPEAQAILDKGYAYIEQIRQSNEGIPGEEISAKIEQIEVIVASIFDRAREHPEVIGDLDRLMDYYLPVTVKLLDAYEDLDRQPVQSESILESKREIEGTLDTLNTAFSKLLDSIFRDMTWDVSTDIHVLRTVLAQEGLTDNPFEGNTTDKSTGSANGGQQ